MGMDQYFTTGEPWPQRRETLAELRECRALNYKIRPHLRDKVYLRGDFKSGEVTLNTITVVRQAIQDGTIWDGWGRTGSGLYDYEQHKQPIMLDALERCEVQIKDGHRVHYFVSA